MIFYGLFGAFTLAGAFVLLKGVQEPDAVVLAVGALFFLTGVIPLLADRLEQRRRAREKAPPRGATLAYRLVPTAPPRRDAATQQAAFAWVFVGVAALFGIILGANWDNLDEEMRPIATGVVGIAGTMGLFITALDLRRRARRRAGGGAFVEIDAHPVQPGRPAKLLVHLDDAATIGNVEVIAEAYQRFAVRGAGSDRRTHFHGVAGIAKEVKANDGVLVIPTDAPPSEGRAVQWFVTLRGKDDWERSFALEVVR